MRPPSIGAGAAWLLLGAAAAYAAGPPTPQRLPSPGPAQTLVSSVVKVAAGDVPLQVPPGFKVELLAEGLSGPREMVQLPNGDLLVVESTASGVELIPLDAAGKAGAPKQWARYLHHPYGILYRDGSVYLADNQALLRYTVDAAGSITSTEYVVRPFEYDGKAIGGSGHWTRDILFSRDGKRFFIAVGSESNMGGTSEAGGHAAILEYEVGSPKARLFATGLRNPVSLALRPGSDEIWVSVNERDGLGDELVPDFVTAVKSGGFYGWPYYYIGAHEDPRRAGERPDLASQVVVPDVLLPSHTAPLGLSFYEGKQFPERYRGGLFVGMHGSWNRGTLAGYKVVFIPFRKGKPVGKAEDFLSGFIKDADKGQVYGRPVAPLMLKDGSLVVSDDGAGRIWRVRFAPTSASTKKRDAKR